MLCKHCNQDFPKTHRAQKFCNPECRFTFNRIETLKRHHEKYKYERKIQIKKMAYKKPMFCLPNGKLIKLKTDPTQDYDELKELQIKVGYFVDF